VWVYPQGKMKQPKLLAIDLGHNTPPDTGAVGFLKEDECTRKVLKELILLLDEGEHPYILVKPEKATSVNNSLNQRCYAANMSGADLFISLHCNAFNEQAHGTEIFLSNLDQNKVVYHQAKRILNNLCNSLGTWNRGLKAGNLAVLRGTKMPAMLIEFCFIDNKKDCEKFNVKKAAESIFTALYQPELLTERNEKMSFTPPNIADLTVLNDTLLKPSTEQSRRMPSEDKAKLVPLIKGTKLKVDLLCDEEGHFEIEVIDGTLDGKTGYVFSKDVNLSPK
jgi:N-acetylmuramoyl-L-alanine amidase